MLKRLQSHLSGKKKVVTWGHKLKYKYDKNEICYVFPIQNCINKAWNDMFLNIVLSNYKTSIYKI
jgi:hypothetical protein